MSTPNCTEYMKYRIIVPCVIRYDLLYSRNTNALGKKNLVVL